MSTILEFPESFSLKHANSRMRPEPRVRVLEKGAAMPPLSFQPLAHNQFARASAGNAMTLDENKRDTSKSNLPRHYGTSGKDYAKEKNLQ